MNYNKIAQYLDNAVLNATAVTQISTNKSINLNEAYAIQSILIARRYQRGEKLTGLKLGFTSKAKMEQMGVHDMIWGRLTDEMAVPDGGSLNKEKFIHARAEPEIAFRISKKIQGEISLDNVHEYFDAVAVAIEIIDSRYKNFKFSLEDVVADNCSSSGYCIGTWQDAHTSLDDIKMELRINGEVAQQGSSNDILGNPLESMVAIARLANDHGERLDAGDIVLAGAATPAVFIEKEQTIEAYAEGLGSVRLVVV